LTLISRECTFTYRRSDGTLSVPIPYCTEYELLNFANRLRVAGAADPIEALMPSTAGAADACLIANTLNFGSLVTPQHELVTGEYLYWLLELPVNLSAEVRNKLAAITNHGIVYGGGVYDSGLRLPRLIGNAAHAFDVAEDGWTVKYRKAV
jgi:hypothetical protein